MSTMVTEERPRFGYDRETWQRQWRNSTFSRLEEKIAATRQEVLDLIVAGRCEEGVALWWTQVDEWTAMLEPQREAEQN